jgi:DNA-binding beta-propeller fold protein YncE
VKIRLLLFVLALLSVVPILAQDATQEPNTGLTLEVLGSYSTDIFDEGGAEIAAYHPESNTVFVVNGASSTIDILDISDPTNPIQVMQIDATEYGGSANSVAIYDDVVAVAIEADPAQETGLVAFFDVSGVFINSVPVGALPDMLTFTPDGTKVIVAN